MGVMLYLYLDESGDLGFDFVNKKPSKFFVVTILALNGHEANRLLINGVKSLLFTKLPKLNVIRPFILTFPSHNDTLISYHGMPVSMQQAHSTLSSFAG
jgi:hypothetical protein